MFLPGQWASPSDWSRNSVVFSDFAGEMTAVILWRQRGKDHILRGMLQCYNIQEKLCTGICLDCAQRSHTKKEICILESHSFTSALIDTFMFDGWGWKEEQVFLIQWCSYHNVSLANIFSCIIIEAADLVWNIFPMWIWSLIGECAG